MHRKTLAVASQLCRNLKSKKFGGLRRVLVDFDGHHNVSVEKAKQYAMKMEMRKNSNDKMGLNSSECL